MACARRLSQARSVHLLAQTWRVKGWVYERRAWKELAQNSGGQGHCLQGRAYGVTQHTEGEWIGVKSDYIRSSL